MTLLTIENGELKLNTNLDEYTFGKTAHDAVLNQEGVIFDGKNFRQWTFEEVKSFDGQKNGEPARLVFYCTKDPFGGAGQALTLAQRLEEGGDAALQAVLAVCKALTAAAKDGNPLPRVGAGGIMVEGDKVLFAPETLFTYAANTLSAEEGLLQQTGYINETISGLPELCFERAVIIYRLLAGHLPFSAKNSVERNADIFDNNFLPIEYCINRIDQGLAREINRALCLNSTAVNIPGKRKKGKASDDLKPQAGFPLEKLEEAWKLSQAQSANGSDKDFEEKVAAYKKSQNSKINTKRTIKRNSTTIGVIIAAIVIVTVIVVSTIKTRGTDYTSVGLTSSQTISAYMNGINQKDTMLLSDFGDGKAANSFADMVSRIYVLHKQRLTYGDNGFGYPANWLFYITDDEKYSRSGVYGVTNLKIDGKDAEHVAKLHKKNEKAPPLTQEGGVTLQDGSTSVHKIDFYMIYTEGEEVDYLVDKISDTITLTYKKNRWIITDIVENKRTKLGVDCAKFKADYFAELKKSNGEVIPAVDALRSKYEWLPEDEAMQREREKIIYEIEHPFGDFGL